MSARGAFHESSTARLLSALASIFVIIFMTEALVMAFLSRLPSLSLWIATLLDSALLSMLVVPFVYAFVLRPLERHASAKQEAERALRQKDDDIREAVQKYQSIVENAVEGIYQTTPAGEFLTANAALAHMLGYESLAQLMSEDAGIAARVYADPASRETFVQRLAQDGAVLGLEFELLCRDGTRRWVSENARVVRDAAGAVQYYEGMMMDITDRKRAQMALQESEAKFKALFDAARVGIIVMDRQVFLDCNLHAERLFACAKSDLVGHSPVDFSPRHQPDGHPSAARAAQYIDAALDGAPQFFEWSHIRRDGTPFDAEVSLNRVDLRGAMRLQAVVRDITARKQAEADLRLQGAALDAAANAIVITGRDGAVVWANSALYASSGYDPSEVVGKNPRDLFKSGTHDSAFYADLWKTLLAGDVWRGEIVNRRKDGSLCTEDMTITPIKDAHGVATHFVAVKQDITERKQLELQFLRTQRLESIGLLAGGIAHDLNNVLAPILMSVEMLRETAVDDDGRSLVDTIGASAKRGVDMVAQVLSFARGSEGRRVDIQLRHLIRDMEKTAAKTFPKNIEVITTANHDLWTVHGDPTQLHQVLLNLCINARDAMPDGGQIRITAANDSRDEGPHVVLDVEDTGVGMPQAIIDRIFDPFFTTKPTGKGTGLGLSTSLTIVKRHGGFVEVTSDPGTRTRFRVFLPAQTQGLAQTEGTRPPEWPRGHGETVLVVDDEAAFREITRHTLEAFGYHVILASHGAEAVSLYSEHARVIAMVITDLSMPVMGGVAVIHALKAMNPDVAILAVSGSSGAMAPAGTQADATPVLAKPFSREALLRAVRDGVAKDRSRNLNLFA